MKPVESVISLPSQLRFISPALAFIRATAASCGFSDVALNEIEVASEEALTNVIDHAFEGHCDETFRISVGFTEADFLITIYEKGMPFSPDRVADYDPGKLENTLETAGLGVFLMKKMMDDVVFKNLGRDGKSLTLVKHIKDGQRNGMMQSDESDLPGKRQPDAAKNISFEIRPFRPEDALEISQCAYKAYGYTYEPYIYFPEQIVEMNTSGKLHSFVAADTNTGEIVAHSAFKYKNPGDRLAELGVAFVKPDYRSSGIFNALTNFCHEKAIELHLFGSFVRAVTSHIGSQKVADNMGYMICGVLLGLFPADVDFKALAGKIRQKETGLLLYRHLCEGSERTIYLPLRHTEIVLEMFRSFKISVRCGESSAGPTNEQSRIHVEVVPVLNIAEVEIGSIGVDIVPELQANIHTLCLKHIDMIFLHIDMEEPSSPFVVQQCEKMGFFFSGVLPFGMNNRHEIILQYMNNININFDIIKPYSQNAVDILQYVKSARTGEN